MFIIKKKRQTNFVSSGRHLKLEMVLILFNSTHVINLVFPKLLLDA